jgi:hypothetical protein
MTLLDRFRAGPRQKHPDPLVRLAFVAELPLSDRETIEAIARDDEDPRVRRAAVKKLLDPAALGRIGRDDRDTGVREAAAAMLRDIALEVFEGVGETEALDAVEALGDAPVLAHIAKQSAREVVSLRALSRITDTRHLGSIARHGAAESVRRGAFEMLRDRGDASEVLAVAMSADHKDVAVAAVEHVAGRVELEQIAARSRNKAAAKHARALLKSMDEQNAAAEAAEPDVPHVSVLTQTQPEDAGGQADAGEQAASQAEAAADAAEAAKAEADRAASEQEWRREAVRRAIAEAMEARRARFDELAAEIEACVALPDIGEARKRIAHARREWDRLGEEGEVGASAAERFKTAIAQWAAREQELRETEDRTRRDAHVRLLNLLRRTEPLVDKADVSAKAVDRALRDIRAALADIPPLPSRQDFQDVSRRLKAAQSVLQPKLQELREAEEWHRWANATVQEQLCARMEELQTAEDPDRLAAEVRDLQRRWREAADVPRAQADALWRRFKAAHDIVWARCEAHFSARAETLRENLARKTLLCEKAEALADSTNWLQTAEGIKALQAEWKTIGPVPHGSEKAVWERFRQPCDRFFTRRSEDLARRKAVWSENLVKKTRLCERAEALATSEEWDAAAAEMKQLQAEWKTVGPVKKTRSEAIWQRFRAACDQFFERYAHRHDEARAARLAARVAICDELEQLASAEARERPGSEVLASIRTLQNRWRHETADRLADPAIRELDRRFATAFSLVCVNRPDAVRGTDLDPDANRSRMEALVTRIEELARSVAGVSSAGPADAALSPTTRLAAMLKEALASNTIGGVVDDRSRKTAAIEEVRQAQAAWSRIGPLPDAIRVPLSERFQRAARLIMEKAGPGAARAERPDTRAPRR